MLISMDSDHRLYGADPTNRDGLQNALPESVPEDAVRDADGEAVFEVEADE